MARIVENEAGFKVIEVSRQEIIEKLGRFGVVGISDYCASSPTVGYYVAVLDQWYCQECYNRFIQGNTPEPDDAWFEDDRFECYRKLFNL